MTAGRPDAEMSDIGMVDQLALNGVENNFWAAARDVRVLEAKTYVETYGTDVQIDPTPDIPYPNLIMAPQWRTDAVLRATGTGHILNSRRVRGPPRRARARFGAGSCPQRCVARRR